MYLNKHGYLYTVVLPVLCYTIVGYHARDQYQQTHNEFGNNFCPSITGNEQHECSTSPRQLEFASSRHVRCNRRVYHIAFSSGLACGFRFVK